MIIALSQVLIRYDDYIILAGYGEINYRDRALIVTILFAIIIVLRIVQIVLSMANFRRKASTPIYFSHHGGAHLSRRGELMAQT